MKLTGRPKIILCGHILRIMSYIFWAGLMTVAVILAVAWKALCFVLGRKI